MVIVLELVSLLLQRRIPRLELRHVRLVLIRVFVDPLDLLLQLSLGLLVLWLQILEHLAHGLYVCFCLFSSIILAIVCFCRALVRETQHLDFCVFHEFLPQRELEVRRLFIVETPAGLGDLGMFGLIVAVQGAFETFHLLAAFATAS